jgi:hypothetical protein
MLAVPGIEGQVLLQPNCSTFWMTEGSPEIRLGHGLQQANPTGVQSLQQGQRSFDGSHGRIRKIGPKRFVVWFDCGDILGERQLETDIGVHVAVWDMVDHLPRGPTAGTVRGVQLLFAQSGHRRAQTSRGFGDFKNPLAPLLRRGRFGE